MVDRMRDILVHVGERKEHVLKDLFKERDTSDFQPFRMVTDISNIEEFL